MAGKRNSPRSSKRRVKSGTRAARGEQLLIAEEGQRALNKAMAHAGFSREDQAEVHKRSLSPRRKSGPAAKKLLARTHAISDLLSFWQKSGPFVDAQGAPKTLPIRGRGTSLQSLARLFVPDMKLNELVKELVSYGEVHRVKGNKVALVGTILMLMPRTPDITLANVSLGVERIIRTILHNASRPEGKRESGLLQRYAVSEMTEYEFKQWAAKSRSRLHQQIMESEGTLKIKDSKHRRGKSSGVALFVFRDE